MTAEQSNDLCLQCHLQGDVTVYRADSHPFSFSPGDRLRDHREDFVLEADLQPTLGIASHGASMLRSRCYSGSDGKLTCVLCHDPHKPSADFDAAYYDNKCHSCHTTNSCSRITQGSEKTATGCSSCHMRRRPSQEGIHLVLTDHTIVREFDTSDPARHLAGVMSPNASQIELHSAWPDVEPDRQALGSAYVLLHETMGPQHPSLERGVELLAAAIRGDPNDLESRFWLGSGLVSLGRGKEAIPWLTEALIDQPKRHAARFRLALAYELTGDYDKAITHYQQLLETAPDWPEPYPRLAQLYLARQQPEMAVAVLTQQLSYQEDALAYAQLALAKRMRGGSHDAAMATVGQAIRLDPRLPTAYMHRAALHLLVEQQDRARQDFQRVLQLDPHHQEAAHALQALGTSAPD